MLARALDAGVPCGWGLGDEVYGADRRLRAMLEERGKPYLLTVRGNDALEAELDGGGGRRGAAGLARAPPPRAWRGPGAGAGTQGEGPYDWARGRPPPAPGGGGDAPPRERWLLVRRSTADPADLAYFVVFAPAGCGCSTWRGWRGGAGWWRSASRPPSRRSAWRTTRSGAGAAGTGTSPWRCWRSPCSPGCGPA